MTYNIRRYSASGVYYGERVYSGDKKACLQWLMPVLKRRVNSGWEVNRDRNNFELTHDDRAEVITYVIRKVE